MYSLFFFNNTSTTDIYPLSLHDALPISLTAPARRARVTQLEPVVFGDVRDATEPGYRRERQDRKSTRLNSSHVSISYAVFCLKKKKFTELKGSVRTGMVDYQKHCYQRIA